jgi:hypothetical protein
MKSPIIPIKFHETNDFLHIFGSTKQEIVRFNRGTPGLGSPRWTSLGSTGVLQ